MSTSISSLKNHYRLLHDCRMRLRLAGMLADSENEKAKQRIEKWAEKNGLESVKMKLKKPRP